MADASVRRVESHLEGTRGNLIFRRAWLPADPERVLVVVHGYAEHSGRYDHFGAWFAERGCAVHGFDHVGHGRSSGPRAHVGEFSDFLDDLQQVLDRVRGEHAGIPVTLVGHSMGGLVTAGFLVERRPAISSAVLSAAALELGPGVSRARILTARALRRLMPRLSMGSGLDAQGLSRDPQVVRAYLEDPLVFRTMTASLAAVLLEAIPDTAARASEVRVPLLVLHGEDDPMCPAEGSRRFFADVDVPGSDLRVYPKLKHEIFNEPEQERVFQDLLDWLGREEP